MSLYMVQSVSSATTKGGKNYLRLNLYETGGRLWQAVCWNPTPDLKAGNVVDALTEESDYQGQRQLTVKALRVVSEKATGDSFLPRSTVDVDSYLSELRAFVSSVENPGVHAILGEAVNDPRWARAPAGMKVHHAYLGGLLVHTVGLCRVAHSVSILYPFLRRDLLIFAAIMHDLGKLDELSYESNIDYTDEGRLQGHITIGLLRLEEWFRMCEVEKTPVLIIPDKTKVILRHMILSHHGARSYGSPIEPLVLEAAVFAKLDQLDATIGSITAAIDRTPGKVWSDRAGGGMNAEQFYTGGIE